LQCYRIAYSLGAFFTFNVVPLLLMKLARVEGWTAVKVPVAAASSGGGVLVVRMRTEKKNVPCSAPPGRALKANLCQ
jgi:hypothetical protein